MLQSNTRPAANSFPFAVLNQEEITALYCRLSQVINRRAIATVLSIRKNPQKVCAGQRIHEYPVLY